ncbi:MAG: lipid-A-disaccharide synthase [Coxiella sp. DG_40]|nr:MAG: lipid-A-disaccharide synthase [Coxiella sp. DG_40]
MSNKLKILIVTGEASGDLHAAKLVKDVCKLNPNIDFWGMGGINMREAGVNIIVDTTDLAVMGLFDVLTHLPKIYEAKKIICNTIANNPPNLLILIDYSGFNLRLAKIAKQKGIKILYYISPQLWASRQGRIKKIRKYIDKMAVIFPFEIDFYKQFNIPVCFVGHPLSDIVHASMSIDKAKQAFTLNPRYKTIGLFPGSRKGEIKRLLPVMLKSAQLLKQQFPDTQFVLALASSLTKDDLNPYLKKFDLEIKIVANHNYDVMQVCDAIIAASGTVTLEIALMEIPMLIIYKISPPYFPIKLIIKIPYIGLCNIIAGKQIVKELLQQHANPKNISNEITHILTDNNYRNTMITELKKIKEKLTTKKTENLAQLVVNMLP